MSREQLEGLDPHVVDALQELEGIVTRRYPGTTFEVARAADEPESILLWATVDVDDPDEVIDLVLDRMLEMQIDDGLPVHLVPIRTSERILAELRAESRPRGRLAKVSYPAPQAGSNP